MLDLDYRIRNYGYIEEPQIKIVAFQIIKALLFLENLNKWHGQVPFITNIES